MIARSFFFGGLPLISCFQLLVHVSVFFLTANRSRTILDYPSTQVTERRTKRLLNQIRLGSVFVKRRGSAIVEFGEERTCRYSVH